MFQVHRGIGDYRQNLSSVPVAKRIEGSQQRRMTEINIGIGSLQCRMLFCVLPGFCLWFGTRRVFGVNY